MQNYTTDAPEMASELFDGELVVANYGSGTYYSVSSTGALIWQGLRHGLSDSEVSDWLAGHFAGQAAEIPALVMDFIAEMHREGLVLPIDKPAEAAGDLPALEGEHLAAPQLERYDDMKELLLLDPVHDVAEAGWPKRADD